MPIRPLHLPDDLDFGATLIQRSYQYPENEAWSVSADEKEGIVDGMKRARRLWPLVRAGRLLFPRMLDEFQGYVWEEEGTPVGMANFRSLGGSGTWHIDNVAVLPDHRRRGIGHRLVSAALESMRAQHGRMVLLNVIAGNVPAYALYTELGFVHFSGSVQYTCEPRVTASDPSPPGGYTILPLRSLDLRARRRFEEQITPDAVRAYEPVEHARSRPLATRVVLAVLRRSASVRSGGVAVHESSSGRLAAVATYDARTRTGGVSGMSVRLDPDHGQLASYLVDYLRGTVGRFSAGQRIRFVVPRWQDAVVEAARACGCDVRLEFHRLARSLD